MRKRPSRSIQVLFLGLIITTAALASVWSMNVSERHQENIISAYPLFVPRAPIVIESDAQLTAANGVTGGDGSAANPYAIECWDIDGSTSLGVGILVSNVSSHIVIRNVNVHSDGWSYGIVVFNATNCAVEGVRSSDNDMGIMAVLCKNITIANCTLESTFDTGIAVASSENVTITGNIVADAAMGIYMLNVINSEIVGNTIVFSWMDNIALESASRVNVTGNMMNGGSVGSGLAIYDSDRILVEGNLIRESLAYGVGMGNVAESVVRSNIIAYTDGGPGVNLSYCSDTLVYRNDFIDNGLGNGSEPKAWDAPTANRWNESYPLGGNYWNDANWSDLYSGPGQNLSGPDGILDTPYTVSPGLAEDHYPIAAEFAIGDTPTAAFNVTPTLGSGSTVFKFNASLSWYPAIQNITLQFRWDFDGDGTWDTDWGGSYIEHSFGSGGGYLATLEVMAPNGHTDNMTVYVEVDPFIIPEFPMAIIPVMCIASMVVALQAVRRRP